MERIHILAKVDSDSLEMVVDSLNKVNGITEMDVVTGTYDLLMCLEGESVARMLASVVREIRSIDGIMSTETLVVINLE